ncbi:DISARM system phospholipase D-like protein DrmC [Pilimelia columellifera]|uniref:PLD phosphodiesterase domain-containing protein n=1 Tax=Pilimelia columellifera subsp. columellifera TaxID=706583 RepID=A0ABN3NM64_9ACTN
MNPDLTAQLATLAHSLGPDAVADLAEAIHAASSRVGAPQLLTDPAGRAAAAAIEQAVTAGDLNADTAAAYAAGFAAGYRERTSHTRTEVVWTGPSTFDVPVRATAQVLVGVVNQARTELIVTTYSARPYPALRDALTAAVARGVDVWVVVETLSGAGSAIQGDQPAQAFADLPGVQLWSWDVAQRPDGAKMHAKTVIADEQTLLVTSANLTTSGLDRNIEAGILIHGGPTPRRAAEHLRALRRDGVLLRI